MRYEDFQIDAAIEDGELSYKISLLHAPADGRNGYTWADHWSLPSTVYNAEVSPVIGDPYLFEATADTLADRGMTLAKWLDAVKTEIAAYLEYKDEPSDAEEWGADLDADIADSLHQ